MVLFSKFDPFGESPLSPQPERPPLADSSQAIDEIEQSIRYLESTWKMLMEMRSKIKAIGIGIADLHEDISRLLSAE